MKISDFSIRNPVKVAVGVIMLCMYGTIALISVPVQLTPDVSKPVISIDTQWPGASPHEVEKEIVEEQEEQLKGIEGMTNFRTECDNGDAEIDMEFAVGTDMQETLIKVTNALQQVREYPEDAGEPRVRTVNVDDSPVCWMVLTPLSPTVDQVRGCVEKYPHLREVAAPVLAGGDVNAPILYRLAQEHAELRLLTDRVDYPRQFLQDKVAARLEKVSGVANVNIYGGAEQELQVVIDPLSLAARQITIPDLRAALSRENKDVSAGDVWEAKSRVVVRTVGQFSDPGQVRDAIVAWRDSAPVYVRDVAEVRIGNAKPDRVVRHKGMPCVGFNIQKKDNANALKVVAGVKAALVELNAGVLKPRGLKIAISTDATTYIRSATALVRNNIFIGGSLAVIVLMLFMRSGRSTLVVAIAIPISVVGTFLIMRGLGRTINVISLAGVSFAVGMVVDNAIVVLENIFSHYQRGESPRTAASQGTTEVWGAVLASTLTTLAVFVPVLFVEDQAGQLFRDISIAISGAVALSLLVSLTVIPAAAARLWIDRTEQTGGSRSANGDGTARSSPFTAAVVRLTRRLQDGQISSGAVIVSCLLFFVGAVGLAPSEERQLPPLPYLVQVPTLIGFLVAAIGTVMFLPLAWRARRVAIVLTMVVLSLGVSNKLRPGTEYLPEGSRNSVWGRVLTPPGYNLDQMSDLGRRIEERLRPYWETRPGTPEAASLDGPLIRNFFVGARPEVMFMGGRAVDPSRAAELTELFREATADIPGVVPMVSQMSVFERSSSGGRRIDIEIVGDDMSKLFALGQRINDKVAELYPQETTKTFVRAEPSLELSSPEMHIRPNREKAAQRGVSTVDLGYTINALVDGAYAGDYWHEGRRIDLIIVAPPELSRRTQDIASIHIGTPTGEHVPLTAVAEIERTIGPETIVRIDRDRAVTIQVRPGESIALEDAVRRIDAEILEPIRQSGVLEGGRYHIRLGGTADQLEHVRGALGFSMILAVVITYLLIAALYESFLYPLVIMVSVPMAAVGGFLGLAVLNLFTIQQLDTLTMLGFVILVGTVVNNAILIVNQTLVNIRLNGLDHRTAVTDSVRGRIRPIFMSTSTTVLGMLPLVVYPGSGSELYRGLGSVVLGGLLLSTVFTLVLVPMLFTLMFETQSRLRSWRSSPATRPEPSQVSPRPVPMALDRADAGLDDQSQRESQTARLT